MISSLSVSLLSFDLNFPLLRRLFTGAWGGSSTVEDMIFSCSARAFSCLALLVFSSRRVVWLGNYLRYSLSFELLLLYYFSIASLSAVRVSPFFLLSARTLLSLASTSLIILFKFAIESTSALLSLTNRSFCAVFVSRDGPLG